ncbi:putative sister chromatid cohesion protein [Phaeomoniella chlamydospora]|uniref:Putative sister chromatid cohesion protein n=1 Tax=Phaeomoniella chlamydospora TaxID=158046 RepID=A0A0G2G0T0_PHACM|nr:putative sister chromatid cohesion protein [Phaeomoniella chlamydospora]
MPQVSEEPDKGPENVTSSSLTAIAQVDSILELHAVSYSAEEILAKLLPVWSVDTTASSVVSKQTRKEVLAEIPLPDRQLDTACLNLLAFDNQSDDAAIVRPDAKSALKAWSDIVTIAIESSIDLSSFFYPSTLLNIPGPQQPHPHSAALINLRSAILQYLTYVPPSDASDSLLPINLDEKVWLQKDKLLRWTGITLLASLRSRKDYEPEENLTFGDIKNDLIAIDDFTTQWLDLLPEAWRQDVQLSLLPVVEEGKGKMKLNISQDQWVEMSKNIDALVVETPSSTAKVTTSGTATAAIGTGNKRKWHEKFKAERDARVAAAAAKKR